METPKRAANFARLEEQLLLKLVEKRKHILECKKTDLYSNQAKNAEWMSLAREFNLHSRYRDSLFRSAMTLRTKYENIKKRNKKKNSNKNVSSLGEIGEDSPLSIKIEDVYEVTDTELKEFNISEAVKDVHNDIEFDFISEMSKEPETCDPVNIQRRHLERCIGPINNILTLSNINEEIHNPNSSNGNKMPQIETPSSTSHLKRATEEVWDQIAKAKLEMVQLQIQNIKEEHELKIEYLKKEYELKLKKMELEVLLTQKEYNNL